jgi:hypothetical protein
MQEYLKDRLCVHLRRAAMTVLASGAVAATTLPASAQQAGEAMFLYDRLATFDVTDPARITGQGSVQLSAFRPFDFIAPLGNQAEPAVMDLPWLRDPQLKTVPRLRLQDSIFTVAGQVDAPPLRDYPVIDTLTAYELSRIFDVKQVRAELTKDDTGTTIMLTDSGLSVIRQPAVELIHQMLVIPPN